MDFNNKFFYFIYKATISEFLEFSFNFIQQRCHGWKTYTNTDINPTHTQCYNSVTQNKSRIEVKWTKLRKCKEKCSDDSDSDVLSLREYVSILFLQCYNDKLQVLNEILNGTLSWCAKSNCSYAFVGYSSHGWIPFVI